ncbi:hypothetical protein ACE6H2_006654 [Prunus campanulata]
MGSPTKIPPILITTPPKNADPISQKYKNAEDVPVGLAKSIYFSSEDHDDAGRIGQKRYDALLTEIKRQKRRLRWFRGSNEAVQMREAEARKGFDLFREYAKCVVPSYNWDGITME